MNLLVSQHKVLVLLVALAGATTAAEPTEPANGPSAAPSTDDPAKFQELVVPFFNNYCTSCHSGEKPRAGLLLSQYEDAASVQGERATWEKVLRVVRDHEMPPENKKQPSAVERTKVSDWLTAELKKFDCSGEIDPGQVTVRRLNRSEYKNSVRDLLGVEDVPIDNFPADDSGYGFDNIGDVLSTSPLLTERYLETAEQVVEKAAPAIYMAPYESRRYEAEQLRASISRVFIRKNSVMSIERNGELYTHVLFPVDGKYALRARAYADQAGDETAQMLFRIDGHDAGNEDPKYGGPNAKGPPNTHPTKFLQDHVVGKVAVPAVEAAPQVYEVIAHVEAGKHRYSVAFPNNYHDANAADPAKRGDRNLLVDYIEVELLEAVGPIVPPATYNALFSCHPERGADAAQCAREILERLAKRAFRRPLAAGELERLVALSEEVAASAEEAGSTARGAFEAGVKTALMAILVSPHFLFRVELDDEPENVAVHPIDDFALASRLSYFVWSSLPDDVLREAAASGRLRDPEVIENQVERMLDDPKSAAFVENFGGQWLQTRLLSTISPDPKLFPEFTTELRDAMAHETLLFFGAVLREDLSILDLLDSDFTFVNERLAEHYNLEWDIRGDTEGDVDGDTESGRERMKGDEFRRVTLTDKQRGGVLTQGSILLVTSNPTRTSPVKRGKWILEQILGTPPPPPPPGVEELAEGEGGTQSGSLRERMEKHRADPNCGVCHNRMDPLGFALENFDAVGRWRQFDGEFLVDASGELPGGNAFNGPAGLKAILRSRRVDFARGIAEKLLTYALGRGLEPYDRCAVERMVDQAGQREFTLRSLIVEAAKSVPFRMQRGRTTNDKPVNDEATESSSE